MTELLENIHVALPEMILLITASIALIGDLFFRRYVPAIAFFCAMAGLILAALVSFFLLGSFKIITLHGLFISDDIAQLMKIFIYVTVFLSFSIQDIILMNDKCRREIIMS
ncbi:hypothetical protein Loa_02714 [Legionella oakridgensis ATCC 33761 = DSM 21215]|uniref:Uncharacterized protein n=1 Tax=Legionella oakridgensis ATCC 33761 = DSM 21215 TaxID=1268635 RepID=W0BEH4_9GAMM|nr:hypothetical protein Loa_02714 [Legionella oakridgensis ATCC 33761 = DSM 21215]